ncbi:MAG: HAD-IIB family hydrolase [Candidatus Levyibacteriota bacterium]|nr:MAG: HAD-IIB family hydrolase [Candidatus Levybacteria bacterium]
MKRKYKALMLDLDGTLILNQKGGLPSIAVTKAITKAKKHVHICLATSRPYIYVKNILDHLSLNGYSTINGGSQIINSTTRDFVWEQPMDQEDIAILSEILTKEGISFWFTNDNANIYPPFQSIPKRVFQIYIGHDFTNPQADSLIAKISHLPNIAAHKVPSWNKGFFCITITHAKATKQHGVFEVAKLLGFKTHDMIGVGDGYNDFPLLMSCGLKIAMGNAVPELKEIADYVAPTVENDGIVDIINKFIL